MKVHRDGGALAPMALMRSRNQRPFGEGDLAAPPVLAPHPNRALDLTLRLRELEARASAIAEMNDRALVALILTNAFGRVAEFEPLGAGHFRGKRRARPARRGRACGAKRRQRQTCAPYS